MEVYKDIICNSYATFSNTNIFNVIIIALCCGYGIIDNSKLIHLCIVELKEACGKVLPNSVIYLTTNLHFYLKSTMC